MSLIFAIQKSGSELIFGRVSSTSSASECIVSLNATEDFQDTCSIQVSVSDPVAGVNVVIDAVEDFVDTAAFSFTVQDPPETGFLPENGTGLEYANSYASVEFADAYFLLRQNETWVGLTRAKKESSLVIATDYVEFRYADRFIGQRLTAVQALAWPRTGDLGPMAPQLARAVCEYAVRAAVGQLLNEDTTTGNGYVTSKKTQAGPIVTQISYGGGSTFTSYKSIPQADNLIEQICYSTATCVIR